MARGRMINKEVSTSKKLSKIGSDAARLYFMMYPHTDIKGRLDADVPYIRSKCIPRLGWTDRKIIKCCDELHKVGLIVLYKVEDDKYMQFTRFKDFQTLREDREAKSEIPSPTPA